MKRHILVDTLARRHAGSSTRWLVDTLGLVLSAAVHPAEARDRDGALPALRPARRLFPFVEVIFAGGAYRGETTAKAVAGTGRWRLEIVSRGGAKGFRAPGQAPSDRRSRSVASERIGPSLRWVVERTFAPPGSPDPRACSDGAAASCGGWLEHCRRLAKDLENPVVNALAFPCLGMIRLMLRRPTRPSSA